MKVLFVSENKEDCGLLRRVLQVAHPDFKITSAVSEEELLNIAAMDGPFAAFIIDCDSKTYQPDLLTKRLLDLTGNIPCYFLGTEEKIKNVLNQETLSGNRHNEILLKPFDRDDFHTEVKEKFQVTLEWTKKESYESANIEGDKEDFISMRIKAFYLHKQFPYDVYLEITQTQFMRVIKANKTYSLSMLTTYARKGIKSLYIKKDDHLSYLEDEILKCLSGLKKVNHNSKNIYLTLLRSITIFHQYLMAIGLTPTVLTLADATVDVICNHYSKNRDIGLIFKKYPNYYQGIASKSLLTSFLSLSLATKSGWESVTTKRKLVMAAILMDYNLPEEAMSAVNSETSDILNNFDEQKVKNFLEHPITGAEISKQFIAYPDLDYIIENHHEFPRKQGFPNHLSGSRLTPICAVFNISQHIAADIDGQMITNELLHKVILKMLRDYNHGNFKDPLKHAKKYLKIS